MRRISKFYFLAEAWERPHFPDGVWIIRFTQRYSENNRQCLLFSGSYVNSRCAFKRTGCLACRLFLFPRPKGCQQGILALFFVLEVGKDIVHILHSGHFGISLLKANQRGFGLQLVLPDPDIDIPKVGMRHGERIKPWDDLSRHGQAVSITSVFASSAAKATIPEGNSGSLSFWLRRLL